MKELRFRKVKDLFRFSLLEVVDEIFKFLFVCFLGFFYYLQVGKIVFQVFNVEVRRILFVGIFFFCQVDSIVGSGEFYDRFQVIFVNLLQVGKMLYCVLLLLKYMKVLVMYLGCQRVGYCRRILFCDVLCLRLVDQRMCCDKELFLSRVGQVEIRGVFYIDLYISV